MDFQKKSPYYLKMNKGFSLIELAVTITIIGIIITGAVNITGAKLSQDKILLTYKKMEEIGEAISVYLNTNGCLPYPADITAQPGTANYGREPAANAECATTGGTGTTVLTGGVPFYALGLPDQYGEDGYGSRFTYTVTDTATESGFDSTYTGTITVNDEGSNLIDDEITYTVVSHGQSRKGGYGAITGAIASTCATGGASELDSENCDGDITFIDAPFNDGDITANRYDDLILWKTTERIYEYAASGGSGGGSSSSTAVPPKPTDMKVTTASTNGNLGGALNIQSFLDANGCVDYIPCSDRDITNYMLSNDIAIRDVLPWRTWIINQTVPTDGSNSYAACIDSTIRKVWTSDSISDSGSMLQADWGGSVEIEHENCNQMLPISCCKFD